MSTWQFANRYIGLIGVSGEDVTDGCGQDLTQGDVISNCILYRVYYDMLQGWDAIDGTQWFGLTHDDVAWK